MLSYHFKALLLAVLSVSAAPVRREVPQEHAHNDILAVVRTSLQTNNPAGIQDPVFGLLGAAAAAGGAGSISDADCLQLATADQAFTNAKAASDVNGMVNALIYRALERNTGAVGQASPNCTSITAVNPEIAALSQHQDPASDNAAAINKAIVLTLAQQIASVGGTATDALKSGTFAPGQIGDPTAKGNTCDDANDENGCINTDNLLVPDATEDEINAAVAGVGASSSSSNSTAAGSTATSAVAAATSATVAASCDATATVTVTAGAAATNVAATTTAAAAATTAATATSGQNLQAFTGTLGGAAPAVTAGGRGFAVEGEDASTESFLNVGAALQRSCSIQHNTCADAANSGGQSFSVSDCDTQLNQCDTADSSVTA